MTPKCLINELSSYEYAKVTEVNIESCPIGYPLLNYVCCCRCELSTSSIACDINTQIITRDGDMWIGIKMTQTVLLFIQTAPLITAMIEQFFLKPSPDPQCLLN